MTSNDVRDMLDLPGDARRPVKKTRITGQKTILKGLAREVQNLSGDNPITIVPEFLTFKKRRFGSRKPAARWELRPFKNSARDDQSLILRHWRRKVESNSKKSGEDFHTDFEPEIEDSIFAKFNVRLNIPEYDESLYNAKLQSSDWTMEETNYLIKLVEEYGFRWPIIWDRYDYQSSPAAVTSCGGDKVAVSFPTVRSMEDLKERFYKVSVITIQHSNDRSQMTSYESSILEAMQKFNKQQEIARKKFAEASFFRTFEEAREEENLLIELKRILSRSEKLGYERQELYSRLEAPPTTNPISAYTNSQGLQQLLASLVHADKAKRGKSYNGSLVSPASSGQQNHHNSCTESRRDSFNRESNSGSNGGNKKASQASSDRHQLTPDEEIIFGVRHFDRIATTGPAFRHDKIMKPLISKSSIQQAKISNILSELRIPPRLLMPTYRVGEIFESLQHDIAILLDLRKIADKLQGEINVLTTLKEEREKIARSDHFESIPKELKGDEGSLEKTISEVTTPKAKSKVEEDREDSPTDNNCHKRSASVTSNQSIKRRKK